MIGRPICRAAVTVVKPDVPVAAATRLPAGVLPVLVAVDRVWAMACNSAGEIPTAQLPLVDDDDDVR